MPHLTDTPDLSRPLVEITWNVPQDDIARHVASLIAHNDTIANYVRGLPTRREFEALLADNETLRLRICALELQLSKAAA